MASFNVANIFSLFSNYNISFNKSWELWAAVATVFYSQFIYKELEDKGHLVLLDGVTSRNISNYNWPLGLLCVVIWWTSFGVHTEPIEKTIHTRFVTFPILIFSAYLYCNLNWRLYKGFKNLTDELQHKYRNYTPNKKELKKARKFYKEMSQDFYSTVYSSELPNVITFFLLFIFYLGALLCINHDFFNTLYLHSLGLDIEKKEAIAVLEYFVSGAIAFQMIYSNAVWIFNDDTIFERSPVKRL